MPCRKPDAVFGLRDGLKIGDAVPEDANAHFLSRIQGAVRSTENQNAAYEASGGDRIGWPITTGHGRSGNQSRRVSTRFLRPDPYNSGGRLIFEHSRIHSAALQVAMGRPQVQNMHRRLAEAWERLGERTGADVDFHVGMHRLHAGEPTVAVIPLLRAARRTHEEGRFSLPSMRPVWELKPRINPGGASAKAEASIRMADTLIAVGEHGRGHSGDPPSARFWSSRSADASTIVESAG